MTIASCPQAPTGPVQTQDLHPHIVSLTHDTDSTVALYSYNGIVASRPPSPRKENKQEGSVAQNIKSADHSDGSVPEGNYVIPNVMSSIYGTRSYMKCQYGRVCHGAIGSNSQDFAFGVLALG